MHAVRKDNATSNNNSKKGSSSVQTQKTRRKINPLSPPTTLKLSGITVQFPFRPYECQTTYMQTVLNALLKSENALLESPTGTGKTLCLLCATLAWQRQERDLLHQANAQLNASSLHPDATSTQHSRTRVPTILYASRTHSQISQVVRELRNTRYRPQHAVLGSREQMCVHPRVKTAQATAHDVNTGCSKLGKDRKCRFRNNLEFFRMPNESNATAGGGNTTTTTTQPILDMEELVEVGKQKSICPFYYSRGQLEHAELVFVPYNYLFDADARSTTLQDVPWENAVLIFDEAHNLESFASESASFTLSSIDIAGCIGDVSRAISTSQSMGDAGGELKLDRLIKIKEILLSLEAYLMNMGPQTTFPGNYIFDLFQKSCKITHANHDLLIQELKRINDWFADLRGGQKGSHRLDHFIQCLKRVFGHALEARCMAKSAYYRVHVSPKPTAPHQKQNNGRTISYWCFAPSLAMEELTNLNVRSILVTSGTLSPLPSYQLELGIPFPHTLENPHIIENHQIHTRVIGKGPSGKLLTSSYERRQDAEYYTELGNALIGVARVTPDGMLIFFPSYAVMESCLDAWGGPQSNRKQQYSKAKTKSNFFAARASSSSASTSSKNQFAFPRGNAHFMPTTTQSNIWRRMLSIKAIVVEPKSSADLPDAMAEFSKFLGLPKSSGCILMGVCRGKVSEGIDFANEQSRAVVITGLPFPPAFDPKVKMKREYLDTARTAGRSKPSSNGGFGADAGGGGNNPCDKLSGHEWYTQQAHRAVNQAIGRVIRNRNDYGAVLLMDNRFAQPSNQAGLSKWLRPHIRPDDGFGPMISTLAGFYRSAEAETKSIVERETKAQASASLQYDDDDDEEPEEALPSRIAVLRKRTGGTETDTSTSAFVSNSEVVARMDINELSTRERAPPEPSTASVPVVSRNPNDNSSVFATKPKPSSTQQIAVKLMDRVRTEFSEGEQSKIRKAMVAMKAAGDKKDSTLYHKCAYNIMKMMDDGERFEDCPNDESKLLLMFFCLLPPRYRNSVELRGFAIVVEQSQLGQALKQTAKTTEFSGLKIEIAKLLHSLWCRTADVPLPRDAYLRDCQFLVTRLLEMNGSRQRLSEYIKLIPRTYQSYTFALFDELESARSMKTMKANDRRLGPNSPMHDSKNIDQKRKADDFASAKVASQPSSRHKKQVVNPYAKKKKALTTPVEQKPKRPQTNPVSTTTTTTSVLRRLESEVYRKPTPRNIASRLAPPSRGIVCPVCDDTCKEPFVADCGHVACLSCWLSWLQRSKTCMTCRVPTQKDMLARVVEEKHPGRGAPTLSQLCGNDSLDSEDDEDALVIHQ